MIVRDKTVYVYRSADDKIFYVGQGSMRRAYETDGCVRSPEFLAAVHEYREYTGEECYPEIIVNRLTQEQALQLERFLINLIGLSELVNKRKGRPAIDGQEYV